MHFGGSYKSVLQGITSIASNKSREHFTLEQWAAACGDDLSITRPHCIWQDIADNKEQWTKQLNDAMHVHRISKSAVLDTRKLAQLSTT